MRLYSVLPAVVALLQREKRVTYLALKQDFDFDDSFVELVRDELIFKGMARDEKGRGLIWIGDGHLPTAPAVATPHRQTLLRGQPGQEIRTRRGHRPGAFCHKEPEHPEGFPRTDTDPGKHAPGNGAKMVVRKS